MGAFSIRGPKGGIQGYRTAGATTRVVTRLSDITRIRTREVIRQGYQSTDAQIGTREIIKQKMESQAGERMVAHNEEDDDVAIPAEKLLLAEENRADVLSARSDKVDRDKVADLPEEKASFSSKEGGYGCYRESTKEMRANIGNFRCRRQIWGISKKRLLKISSYEIQSPTFLH